MYRTLRQHLYYDKNLNHTQVNVIDNIYDTEHYSEILIDTSDIPTLT